MTVTEPISRDDIESKFVELQSSVDNATQSAAKTATKVAIGGLILLVIIAFVLGRRRGRQGRTVVEVRRL